MNAEETDHQERMAEILMEGDRETVQMLLGGKTKIRPAGVLSPGIMVPRQTCTPNEKTIYDRMVGEGASWNDIDKAMGGDPMDKKKSKLTPKNVDYFTVLRADFERASDAEAVKKYADPDGKLRTIPIWLPTGELDLVIRHGYSGFFGRVFRFRSFYDTKGEHGPKGTLTCRYLPNPKDNPAEVKYRPCHKEDCPDAKAKRCEFRGVFRVAVPGVSGMGEVALYSKSIYGFSYSMAHLKQIRSAGVLGRIHGLVDGKPFLCLRKVQEDIVHDGKHGTQFIPVIEALLSTFELAQHNEPAKVMARAQAALSLLGGRPQAASTISRVEPPEPAAPEPPAPEPTPDGPDPEKALDEAHARAMAEAEAALAPPPEVVKFIEVLEKKTTGGGMSFPGLRVWARAELGVLSFEKAKLDDLKRVQAKVLERVKSDREEFVALLSDYAKVGSGGELPFPS